MVQGAKPGCPSLKINLRETAFACQRATHSRPVAVAAGSRTHMRLLAGAFWFKTDLFKSTIAI